MPRRWNFRFIQTSSMFWIIIALAAVGITSYIYHDMWLSKHSSAIIFALFAPSATANEANITCPVGAAADVNWYAPKQNYINSLSAVINGSGIYDFIFNSSKTPAMVPYSTYNWCNAPHVRAEEYIRPSSDYKLEYVEVIHRHHKRTPYASNTFPHETYSWNCDDQALFYFGAPEPDNQTAQINWHVYTSDSNPFAPTGFSGSCQFPQISADGLRDSRQHGKDLFGVYHDILHFLPAQLDKSRITFRVTNNQITSQVASQVILGMYPATNRKDVQVSVQPESVDSLEPTYTCTAAASLYSSYGVGSSNDHWVAHLNMSASLFAKLDSVSGIASYDSDWHQSFDHYFDNLSSRLCHAKPLPCNTHNSTNCITEEDANAVFRRGLYEYSFIYRDSLDSLQASTASYGVWLAEFATNLRDIMRGHSNVLYHHNIAHDGSMARLLSILQIDVMVWPSMGSELVFELYSRNGCWYIRVLWQGQVFRSSNPVLGLMDMIPVSTLLNYIDELVGIKASKVPVLCSS